MSESASDATFDLYEHAPCGLLATTPRGVIVSANASLLSWIGYERHELVGRSLHDLMTVAGKIYYESHFAPLLRMQGFVREIALDLVRRDGQTVPVFASANERRTVEGRCELIRVAIVLAMDRRKYEAELLLARRMAEQALQAKSDFLAAFAHEIRNPLGAVKLAADLVADSGVAEGGERPLALLRGSLDRVLVLLDHMLDFSRIDAGKATLDRRRFDLRELVRGVAQTLEPAAEKQGIALQVEIDPRMPEHVMGDAVKLGQVLGNLAGNAVKFTEQGAVVLGVDLLHVGDDSADARFRVSDTGIGIAPERMADIFDAYEQAGPEIAGRYGGTGLGLAISRRIVELHGSKIAVQSQPGVGSTFTFDLSLPLPAP